MAFHMLSAIDETKENYPVGLMSNAWAALVKKFEPGDLFAEQALEVKLSNIKLGEHEDPENLKLKIEDAMR